ncbi:MAG: hypothetical protein IT211_00465 [Armatimonadetes bacterium]|nr:hypothetical protein [Armatimonadota bacterium]
MSKSELILEFIDGTLDSAVEQGLFQEMAQHPELRSELRQFINIADAVHSDREAFAPPAHLEHVLLAGIGLVPAATDSNNAAAAVATTSGGNRFWLMASSFVLGALLAASTVWLMLRGGEDGAVRNEALVVLPSNGAGRNTTQNRTSGQATNSALPTADVQLNVLTSGVDSQSKATITGQPATAAIAPTATSPKPQIRERIKYVYLPSPTTTDGGRPTTPNGSDRAGAMFGGEKNAAELTLNNGSSPSSTAQQATDTAARITQLALALPPEQATFSKLTGTTPQAVAELPSTLLQSSSPLSRNTKQDDGVVIHTEVRYQFARNAVPTQALSGPYSLPENFAAGAYVQLSDAWHLGAEVGVERYAQTLLINRHDTLAIDQQPRYTWGGLAARYDFGAIPSIPARLYFQVTGGATSAGPLVRFRLGAPVQLADGVALSPGFEFSSLVYMFNNQRLFSGRWGATLGTEFNMSKLIW